MMVSYCDFYAIIAVLISVICIICMITCLPVISNNVGDDVSDF